MFLRHTTEEENDVGTDSIFREGGCVSRAPGSRSPVPRGQNSVLPVNRNCVSCSAGLRVKPP